MFRSQDQYFVIYETRIGLFDWVTLSGSLLITGLKIIFILCFDVLLIWPIPVKRRNDVIFTGTSRSTSRSIIHHLL